MSHRANNIRKQIQKRRKNNERLREKQYKISEPVIHEYPNVESSIYEDPKNSPSFHPLWNREIFLLKILISIILVLVTGIIFKSNSPVFNEAKINVEKAMGKELQFSAIASWYEGKFGKPLALLPESYLENNSHVPVEQSYALPVNGKVSESFSNDGRGVMIETDHGAAVEAMSEGLVVFAGKRDDLGNTVIIQHANQSESWYAKLGHINVKAYERVNIGKTVGTVSASADGLTGEFYFAIKQDDVFIDPIQVINLE